MIYSSSTSLIFVFGLLSAHLQAQDSGKTELTKDFLQKNGIALNAVTPTQGFSVYYNCDSLLFMKGKFGDTIKIWTSALNWYNTLDELKELIKNKEFGVTQFAKSIDIEGRINVSSYHQTEFIYRNDSLFEIANSNPASSGAFTELFSEYLTERISKEIYNKRLDSLKKIEEDSGVYIPKLIFSKDMFRNRKKIRLSKKNNFQQDTIELERQWIENGKKCYVIRINNTEEGEETSYAYAIDEDMKFLFWEGCSGSISEKTMR